MKPNILKPLLAFVVFMIVLTVVIIYLLRISVPTLPKIPFLGSSPTTTSTTKEVQIKSTDKQIVLSYEQIQNIMSECCKDIVSNIEAHNQDGKLSLTGKALKPLASDFVANVDLSVSNEKLAISIDYLKLGKIESPSFLKDPLNKAIQKYFDSKINSQYKLKSVRIGNEGIILELI